jgi:hypothetical protein
MGVELLEVPEELRDLLRRTVTAQVDRYKL